MNNKETKKEERIKRSIECIKELYSQLGRSPKVKEYDEYAKLNGGLQRRNLEVNLNLKWNDICLKYIGTANEIIKSKEQILEELVELKEKLGRPPMAKELNLNYESL